MKQNRGDRKSGENRKNPGAPEAAPASGRTQTDICTEYGLSAEEDVPVLRESLADVAGLSELFKVLSDETRTGILHLLSIRELCVCDISLIMEMSLPAVSHHLRLLRLMRLVSFRRDGKQVYYRLDDEHVVKLISVAVEHFREMRGLDE
jgi:ArsR family transcriptional regulator